MFVSACVCVFLCMCERPIYPATSAKETSWRAPPLRHPCKGRWCLTVYYYGRQSQAWWSSSGCLKCRRCQEGSETHVTGQDARFSVDSRPGSTGSELRMNRACDGRQHQTPPPGNIPQTHLQWRTSHPPPPASRLARMGLVLLYPDLIAHARPRDVEGGHGLGAAPRLAEGRPPEREQERSVGAVAATAGTDDNTACTTRYM